MIVSVGVIPNAIKADPADFDAERRRHKRLLRLVRSYGVLACQSPAWVRTSHEMLARMTGRTAAIADEWRVLLATANGPFQPGPCPAMCPSDERAWETLLAQLVDAIHLLVVPVDQLGAAKHARQRVARGPDCVALSEADFAEKYLAVVRQRQTVVATSTDRDVLWMERFQPFRSYMNEVHLFDRYAGARFAGETRKTALPAPPDGADGHGLVWLVEQLSVSGPPAKLVIYSEDKGYRDGLKLTMSDIESAIRGLPRGGGGVVSCELVLADKKHFIGSGHGRHLRSGHDVIYMEAGVEIFDRDTIEGKKICTALCRQCWKHFQEVETTARDNATVVAPLW